MVKKRLGWRYPTWRGLVTKDRTVRNAKGETTSRFGTADATEREIRWRWDARRIIYERLLMLREDKKWTRS